MTTQDDHKWMNQALELAAQAAELGEVPVGCVIVRDNELIASSYNQRELRQDISAHAEIIALREAGKRLNRWRLDDCDLYVTLEPCVMCFGAILQARIAHLYFGAYDPKTGACGSHVATTELKTSSLNHHTLIAGGILETECASQLRDFFRRRRSANRQLGGRGLRRSLRIAATETSTRHHPIQPNNPSESVKEN